MGKSLASLLLLVAGCARSGAAPAESPDQPAADSSNREPAPPEDLQETHPLTDSFARGEFENVIAACRSLQADPQSGARAWCAGLAPAALYALGRDAEALMLIAGTCGHMPPATPESDARASLIALVMVGLADAHRGGHFERDDAQRADLLSSWLEACDVSQSDVERVVDRLNRGE